MHWSLMQAYDSLITTSSCTFTVHGDLTHDRVALLASQLWPHVLAGAPDTRVDLARTSTVDAAGRALLVAAHAYAAYRDLRLCVINAAPDVVPMVQAAGVTVLPALGTRAEFTPHEAAPQPQHACAVAA